MPRNAVKNLSCGYSGKLVPVTEGSRGQGRSHALGFASAGADVVICGIGESIVTVPYAFFSEASRLEHSHDGVARGQGDALLDLATAVVASPALSAVRPQA